MLLLVLIKVTSMMGTCESDITPITIYHVSNCEKKKNGCFASRISKILFFLPYELFILGYLLVWAGRCIGCLASIVG